MLAKSKGIKISSVVICCITIKINLRDKKREIVRPALSHTELSSNPKRCNISSERLIARRPIFKVHLRLGSLAFLGVVNNLKWRWKNKHLRKMTLEMATRFKRSVIFSFSWKGRGMKRGTFAFKGVIDYRRNDRNFDENYLAL